MGTNTRLLAIVAKAPAMYGIHQQVMSCAVTLKLLIHHLIHSTKYRACTGPLLAPNPCLLSLSVQAHWHLLWVSFWSLSKIEKKPIIMCSIGYFSHFSTTSLPPALGTKSATENRLWSFSDIELSSGFKEGMFPQLLLLLYQLQSPKTSQCLNACSWELSPAFQRFCKLFCWMREKGTWRKER